MDFGNILVYTVSYFGLFTAIFFLITLYENKNNLKNPKSKYFPTVSIIVPAYNEEKGISKTIKSLLTVDYPRKKLDIIVVDDGSQDNTYAVAKQFTNQGVRVFRKKNGGKGSALNFGLKRSTSEIVGALDADSFVVRNALKNLIGFFNNPEVMAVTPSLKVHNTKKILEKIQKIEYLIGVLLRKIFSFVNGIHVTPGPFTLYRKSFFDTHGPYDEDNITEDIEIALRIQSHNYIIENSTDADVYTIAPSTFMSLLRQRIRWYVGFFNNIITYKHLLSTKHGNLGAVILPAALVSSGIVIVVMFYAIFKLGQQIVQNISNWYLINFDLLTLLDFRFDSFYLNFNAVTTLLIFSFIVSIVIILLSKKVAREKQPIKVSYGFYLIIYWFLFGFWWFVACCYKIRNKKITWGTVT